MTAYCRIQNLYMTKLRKGSDGSTGHPADLLPAWVLLHSILYAATSRDKQQPPSPCRLWTTLLWLTQRPHLNEVNKPDRNLIFWDWLDLTGFPRGTVFAEELEKWLWEEGMWPWLSSSNGGNSAGETGGVTLCHPERKIFLGRRVLRQPACESWFEGLVSAAQLEQ